MSGGVPRYPPTEITECGTTVSVQIFTDGSYTIEGLGVDLLVEVGPDGTRAIHIGACTNVTVSKIAVDDDVQRWP